MDERQHPGGDDGEDQFRTSESVRERKTRILRERAKLLARRESRDSRRDVLEVVSFRLGDEIYAVESRHVGEVFPLKHLTPLPGTPPFVLGIVNLRGQILSLIDLNVLLRLPRSSRAEGMVLVLRSDEMEMGVVADAFEGVQRLPREEITPPLASLSGFGASSLLGLWRGEISVLDAGRILKDRSLVVNVEEGPEGR